jgi:hypothetical protein
VSGARLAEANGVSEDQVSKPIALLVYLYTRYVLMIVYRFAMGVDGTQTR